MTLKKKTVHAIFYFILFAVTCSFLSACSSGKAALKRGDYYDACDKAIGRLRSSPTNKKSIATLKEAYTLALNYIKQEETNLTQVYSQGNYLQLYNHFSKMHNIAGSIITSPGALNVIPYPNSFNDELNKYRSLATEESYKMGVAALNTGTREAAKTAYYNFLQAQDLTPDYKDVKTKINDALWIATLRVMVDLAPINGAYQLNADFFYNQVLNYTTGNLKDKFIRFYTPAEAQEYQINPDQVLQIGFYDFVVGNVYENNSTYEARRDSVKIGTTRDTKGQPIDVYGTVKAKVTTHTRSIDSRGILDVYIIDYASNRTIASKRLTGGYTWNNTWGSYNGDERALTAEEIAMCNANRQMVPPPPQQLFTEFTKPLYTQATSYIRDYYSNY